MEGNVSEGYKTFVRIQLFKNVTIHISVIRKLLLEPPSCNWLNLSQIGGEHVLILSEKLEGRSRIPRKKYKPCYQNSRRKNRMFLFSNVYFKMKFYFVLPDAIDLIHYFWTGEFHLYREFRVFSRTQWCFIFRMLHFLFYVLLISEYSII